MHRPLFALGQMAIGWCLAAAPLAGWTARGAAGSSLSRDGLAEHRLNPAVAEAYRVRPNPAYQLAPRFRSLVKAPAPMTASHPVVIAGQSLASSARPPFFVADLAAKPFFGKILQAARMAALDPALVHAIIHVESGHRCEAVSSKGAIGLMQVMPETAARYGIANLRSPGTNLRAGTLYLRDLMQLFNNRLELVLAAYNAGEGAVQKYANRIPPYRETQLYVRAVLAKYVEWRGAYGHAATLRETLAPSGLAARNTLNC